MTEKAESKKKAAPKKSKGATNSGRFTKENPSTVRRGKTFKTKLIETVKAQALIGVSKAASKETAEKAILAHWAKRAFDSDDKDSGQLFKALMDRAYQPLKASLPEVEFDVSKEANPAQKAQAVFNAIASGEIPPDVGTLLIGAAKSMTDIEASTDLKERIIELEKLLGVSA